MTPALLLLALALPLLWWGARRPQLLGAVHSALEFEAAVREIHDPHVQEEYRRGRMQSNSAVARRRLNWEAGAVLAVAVGIFVAGVLLL